MDMTYALNIYPAFGTIQLYKINIFIYAFTVRYRVNQTERHIRSINIPVHEWLCGVYIFIQDIAL